MPEECAGVTLDGELHRRAWGAELPEWFDETTRGEESGEATPE